jgi:bifunctional non-homologous end joining protein LigD
MCVFFELSLEPKKLRALYNINKHDSLVSGFDKEHHKKRDFRKTLEPQGCIEQKSKASDLRFVVQKHDATKFHYDFRLETEKGIGGVLKSWAVPKGISLDPKIKRLAVLTDYLLFEGVIPEGNEQVLSLYWTQAHIRPNQIFLSNSIRVRLVLHCMVKKLRGRFYLIKTNTENQWLLLKKSDEFDCKEDLTVSKPESVLTGRTDDELATGRKQIVKTTEVQREKTNDSHIENNNQKTPLPQNFPSNIKPILATLVDKP